MKASELKKAVHDAERLSRERGIRLTSLRRRVLELVLGAAQPIGAYALLDALRAERAGVAPPTVYRALDFLLRHKFIHRLASLNAYVACWDVEHPHESQFLICRDCGLTEEIHDEALADKLRRHGRSHGFAVEQQMVEVRGLCAECRGEQ